MARINRLWHSTAMASDYDSLYRPMQRLFGAIVLHDHVSHEPAVGRRGGMIWLGDNSIEIGAPVGEHSPVRNFVEKWGGGMHSIAMGIDDAPTVRAELEALGVKTAANVSDLIWFTHPASSEGLMVEWCATHTDDDPRWGYALREREVEPVAEAKHYSFVTAVVNDPQRVANRFAELFGTAVVRSNPDAGPADVSAIVSMVDACLLFYPMPQSTDESMRLWGIPITRNRFYGHGLRVDDLEASLNALGREGVKPMRSSGDGYVLLDPALTGVPTFLSDQLLPEDPRR